MKTPDLKNTSWRSIVNNHSKMQMAQPVISKENYWKKLSLSMSTNGSLPAVGDQAPNFILANSELENVSLETYMGKYKILTIIPSFAVPICKAFIKKLNDEILQLEDTVLDDTVLFVISADLPFTQQQFCELEGLNHVVPLSTFRSTFAVDYGVKIINGALTGLMAHAVVVLNEENNVIYSEMTRELTKELNTEWIITTLKLQRKTVSEHGLILPNNRRESFRVNPLKLGRTICYCKIQLPIFDANETVEYKHAYTLASNEIYEALKLQRHSIKTAIPDVRFANVMQLNLRDISSTGCSMFNHSKAFSYFLVLHKVYKNCTLHMPNNVEIKISFKIVLKHRLKNNTGEFSEIIGVEFIGITQSIESDISYYVREIERQLITSREVESVLEPSESHTKETE